MKHWILVALALWATTSCTTINDPLDGGPKDGKVDKSKGDNTTKPDARPDVRPDSKPCTPETDAQLCKRLKANCGRLVTKDNCGTDRTVSACGTCQAPEVCGGGGITNVCSACKHPTVTKNCDSTGWCKIPNGCFFMGSPTTEPCRGPVGSKETQHTVVLTHSFEIQATPVTRGQFQQEMGFSYTSTTCGSSCPMGMMGWYGAVAYCNALSKKKGLTSCYKATGSNKLCKNTTECLTGESCLNSKCVKYTMDSKFKGQGIYNCLGYRLPTEAEWEYAYRAGTKTGLYNGELTTCNGKDPLADKIAWFDKNSGKKPRSVMAKLPNLWGLYDMAGNVWELANDWYQPDLGSGTMVNPIGSTFGSLLVAKGGAAYTTAGKARAATRVGFEPEKLSYNIGFRCVRTTSK